MEGFEPSDGGIRGHTRANSMCLKDVITLTNFFGYFLLSIKNPPKRVDANQLLVNLS